MVNRDLKGIIAAPFTPMDEKGEIRPEIISQYAHKLKIDGLSGVFICGTTGEGMSMTIEERMIITEQWMKFRQADFKVIVHVGTTSAKQSKELAEHAQKIGADGTSTMGPLFLKPNTLDPLVEFCAKVASGAPKIPFFYYHIPIISGVNFSMNEFIELAKLKIPNFAGIKYTHENLAEMKKCNEMDGGKWKIFNGFDEKLIDALSIGIESAVGSTYNYMSPIYLSMIEDFKKGMSLQAQQKQQTCNDIIKVLFDHGGPLMAGKAIMKMVGVDCGPCRLPLTHLSNKTLSDLEASLKSKGFFELN